MNANVDVTNVALTTNRLILRPFNEDDLEDLFEYASVEGVGERAGWKHHENIAETTQILEMFIKEKKTFAVVLKENNKVIGSIGIEKYGREESLSEFFDYKGREIGFVLSKDYWGQGLMPEALKRVIEYCFNEMDYDFLLCGHFDFNTQSARVQEKLGFIPYRRLLFETRMDAQEKGILSLLVNPHKNIEFQFSHPETLLIK